ncbi:MAG TPA: hypothetical protein V6D03_10170 [Candidatus Caenarcaniphilales bacterium]
MNLDRSKIVAIITGAIALILGIAYLTVVQLLDFRGEMLPAPESQLPIQPTASLVQPLVND